jgi:hypothetical protein
MVGKEAESLEILSLKWSMKDEAKLAVEVESVEGSVLGVERESKALRQDHSFLGWLARSEIRDL